MLWRGAIVVFFGLVLVGIILLVLVKKNMEAPRMKFVELGPFYPISESPKPEMYFQGRLSTSKPMCKFHDKPNETDLLNSSRAWQKVTTDGLEVYLRFAYLDERMMSGTPPWVRVLGIAIGMVEASAWCHLWVNGINVPMLSKASIYRVQKLGSVARTNISSVVVSCQLRPAMPLPSYVSLTLTNPCERYTTYLPLIPHNAPGEERCHINFGLCASLQWYEYEDRDFVEWAEFYRLMGVEFISLYVIDFLPDTPILGMYKRSMFLEIISINLPTEFPIEEPQAVARAARNFVHNSCLYRNLYRYCHTISALVNEYLVPRKGIGNFTGMLATLNRVYYIEPHEVSYTFYNSFFDVPHTSDVSEFEGLVTSKNTMRTHPKHSDYGARSLVRNTFCVALHNFHCVATTPAFHGELGTKVHPDLAGLYVFQRCDDLLHNEPCRYKGEFTVRDDTMADHAEKLDVAVADVFSR